MSSPGADESRCAWCGASLARGTALAGRTRCAACGVATTTPWPAPEELEAAYAGFYRPASGRFAGPGDRLLRRSRASFARRLDRIAPPGPVLDVGAGDGTLVDALAARGRDAVGLEREARGPRVRAGELADVDGSWAAVVFWHSLEHLPSPGPALDRAAGLLAASGVLVVALPNADSLQARAFGDRWLALDVPRHLVHVPARALLARLRADGLRVERVSHLRGGQVVFGWLHGLVGRLPGHPDLYDAIRRPQARQRPLGPLRRAAVLAAAVALAPVAALAALAEAAARRGGSVYVEARRA
jgi:SAM-dependent methyltransferase